MWTRTAFYLDHALAGFVATEKEVAVYDAVNARPHPSIAQRLNVNSSRCLFLERLKPLDQVWSKSNENTRRRWILELVDGLSWLEQLGFTHGDIAIRNMGVDSSDHLKIFDFGSATPSNHL
jgi:serine/threonine protein kinase